MSKTMEKKCPKCNKYANGIEEVKEMFGLRNVNGVQKPQSYCKECKKVSKKRNNQPKPSKKQRNDIAYPNPKIDKIREKKEFKYFSTTEEETGYIGIFDKKQLEEMLELIKTRKAIKIGVDLKEINKPNLVQR